jgi:hypothetical protein
MSVKAFVNVKVLPRTQKKSFAKKMEGIPCVDRVLTIAKDVEQYVNQEVAQDKTPPPLDPVDFIIHITAPTCTEAMQAVMKIRHASNRVESTLTSLAFLDDDEKPAAEKKA